MRPPEFLRALSRGGLAPAYLFSGPEARLKKEALDALAAVVPEGLRAFNLDVFHAHEADPAAVVGAARTAPLGASRRVVVLRGAERMRLSEGWAGSLEAYLRDPAPDTVLVLATDGDEKDRDLRRRFGAWCKEVSFAALGPREIESRLREEAERLGCRIGPRAVAALLEATGPDLGRAVNELAKLRAAVGEGGTVDEEQVATHAAGYAHRTWDELAQAVSARDLAASLRLLDRLPLGPEDLLKLMGALGRRLRLLWFLAEGGGGLPPGVRPWPASEQDLRRDAARFSRREIERALAALLEVDVAVKGTAAPPRLLLERFLLDTLVEKVEKGTDLFSPGRRRK